MKEKAGESGSEARESQGEAGWLPQAGHIGDRIAQEVPGHKQGVCPTTGLSLCC